MKAVAVNRKSETLYTILSWSMVPLLILLTLILLYQHVMLPIAPGSMEENILGSRQIGFQNVRSEVLEHLRLILISTLLAIATGVPAGILITRPGFRDFSGLTLSVANFGQAVPSIAILALFMGIFGLGATTAIFALWLCALLPIIRNTATGLDGVPADIIEAATGMGMTRTQILLKIELPLAFPVIFAGVRTATVINVGTAAMGAFIGAGGLGNFIVTGIALRRESMVLVGAVITATIAVLGDWLLGKIQNHLMVSRRQLS